MRFNLDEVPELFADVAGAMGIATQGMEPPEAGEAAVSEMEAFVKRIGLPRGLKEAGIEEAALTECAELSMSDGSIIYNPKMIMEPEEVLELYKAAY
jgi:alcohol dehydrogenase class IV